MKYYLAFALNLCAFVLQIGIMVHEPPPSFGNVFGAVIALIGLRVMFPIVQAHLRGE